MPASIRQIATFLGKSITDAEVEKIREHCQVDTMRNNPMVNMKFLEEMVRIRTDVGNFINKG